MNQKVHLFNQTIKNILCNFIPHETVDDRDPQWINSKIKGLIQEKNIAKKCYLQNSKDIQLFRRFQCIQNLLTAESRLISWIPLESKPEGILVNIENIFK